MFDFYIDEYKFEADKASKETIVQLSELLAEEEPDRLKDFTMFWKDWLQDKHKGSKLTLIAREAEAGVHRGKVIGVARFWQSPDCDNKWLVEGLQVHSGSRQKGVGRALVEHGTRILRQKDVEHIYVHILRGNIASESLHRGIGFVKVAKGTKNSLGFFRQNIDEYCLRLK